MGAAAVAAAGRWWGRRPQERFPLRFLVLLGAVIGVGTLLTPAWPALTEATAHAVAWACSLVGISALVGPDRVVWFENGAFSYTIIDECTAVVLILIYLAAVLAYPATARQRAIGLAIGVPSLFLLNLVRLVTLAWIGLHAPNLFEAIHVFWWQAFLIGITGLGWFCWARFIVHAGRRSRGGTARLRELAAALGIFAVVFGALVAVGLLAGGITIYAQAVKAIAWPTWETFWQTSPGHVTTEWLLERFSWDYAMLAGYLALFVATPRVRWRRKFRGTLFLGLPVAYLIQIITFVLEFLRDYWDDGDALLSPPDYFMTALTMTARTGILIAIWFAWAHRDWARAFSQRETHRCPVCEQLWEDLPRHLRHAHPPTSGKSDGKRGLMVSRTWSHDGSAVETTSELPDRKGFYDVETR